MVKTWSGLVWSGLVWSGLVWSGVRKVFVEQPLASPGSANKALAGQNMALKSIWKTRTRLDLV